MHTQDIPPAASTSTSTNTQYISQDHNDSQLADEAQLTERLKALPAVIDKLYRAWETMRNDAALALYIAPKAQHSLHSTDASQAFFALPEVDTFLQQTAKNTLLVLGDSGIGKTVFGQKLCQLLWQRYLAQPNDHTIPLFFMLGSITRPADRLIERYLKKFYRLTKDEIANLKQQQFVFILDGYDETRSRENLYGKNALYKWHAKVIISCRTKTLATVADYRALFYPYNTQGPLPNKLQELVLQPFAIDQIKEYLQCFVAQASSNNIPAATNDAILNWADWQTYYHYIETLPGLKELAAAPFILSIIIQALPDIVAKYVNEQKDYQRKHLARIDVYQAFTKKWFALQAKKIQEQLSQSQHSLYSSWELNTIIADLKNFHHALAGTMIKYDVTSVSYKFSANGPLNFTESTNKAQPANEQDPWAVFFDDSKEPKLLFLRHGSFLIERNIGQNTCEYHFLHDSLREYFAATKLFQGAMAQAGIAVGYDLNQRLLTSDHAVIQFIADEAQRDKILAGLLFDIIDQSNNDHRVAIAAANAATILNYARFAFSGRNWQGIRIPNADLSYAILDNTDLRNADLRGVNLTGAWLRQTKLNGSCLDNLTFGELPYIRTNSEINSCCYSPDGKWLAIGDSNGRINIYDNKTFALYMTLQALSKADDLFGGHSLALVFDPSSKLLAGGDGKLIRIWDLNTDNCVRIFKGHNSPRNAIAFSHNGIFLASGGWGDKTLRLWYVESGVELKTFINQDRITSIAFSPDDQFLAFSSYDKTIRLWDVVNASILRTFCGHKSFVKSVAFSPDGRFLASGSFDKTIRLWNIQSGKTLRMFTGHNEQVTSVTFSPDGKFLASGSDDTTIHLWDVASGKNLRTFIGHKHWVNIIAFSPDGGVLASGSSDGTLRLWDIQSMQYLRPNFVSHGSGICSSIFSPDGQLLASVGRLDKMLYLRNTATGEYLHTFNSPFYLISSMAFSPDSQFIAAASGVDRDLCLWNTHNGEVSRIFTDCDSHGNIAFSPDGLFIASIDKETICLWDIRSGKKLRTFTGHTKGLGRIITFNPSGRFLASDSYDKTICLWDVQNGKVIGIFAGHTDRITSIAFSPDSQFLASGSDDKTIRLWHIKSDKSLSTFAEHTGWIISIAFSLDGCIVASSSSDKTLRLWDRSTNKCLLTVNNPHQINAIHWSTDGQSIAYADEQGCITMWRYNIKGNKPILHLLWRTPQTTLHCDGIGISRVTGLSPLNLRLLQQHVAIGEPNDKGDSEKILKLRDQATPVDPQNFLHGRFSTGHNIRPGQWLINIVRRKKNEHAFLILESIESGYYMVKRIDLWLDLNRPRRLFGNYGEALIGCNDISLDDLARLAPQCEAKTWGITLLQAESLLANIAKDQKKPMTYWQMGDGKLYSAIDAVTWQERHNCLTWCEKQLTQIGINVTQQKLWLDPIVALPSQHIDNHPKLIPQLITASANASGSNNNNEEPTTGRFCLVM